MLCVGGENSDKVLHSRVPAQGVQLGPCETHSKGLENRTCSGTLRGPFERLCLGKKIIFLDLGSLKNQYY